MIRLPVLFACVFAFAALLNVHTSAQPPGPRPPDFVFPEVTDARTICFRMHAPQAEEMRLTSSDLPGNGPGTEMK